MEMMIGNTKIIFDETYCVADPQPILDRLAEIVAKEKCSSNGDQPQEH